MKWNDDALSAPHTQRHLDAIPQASRSPLEHERDAWNGPGDDCRVCGHTWEAHQPPTPATPEAGDLVSRAAPGLLSFDPAYLWIRQDGSGYFCVPDADLVFVDDRREGPDGTPEGSIHWIARIDASEIIALRDFLNESVDYFNMPIGTRVKDATK